MKPQGGWNPRASRRSTHGAIHAGGLDAQKYPRRLRGGGKLSLDIPFYRTSGLLKITGRSVWADVFSVSALESNRLAGLFLANRKVRLLGRLTAQTDIRLYCVQGQVSAITDYCIRERELKTKWQPFVFTFPWIDLKPYRRPFRQPNLPNAPTRQSRSVPDTRLQAGLT